jgi:hypothetical protein
METPVWKTPSFWIATIGKLIAVAVAIGAFAASDGETLNKAAGIIVALVFALAGGTVSTVKRLQEPPAAPRLLSQDEFDDSIIDPIA